MKKYTIAICFILIVACQQESYKATDLNQFIPENSAIVIKSPNLKGFISKINTTGFFEENSLQVQQTLQEKLQFLNHLDSLNSSILIFSEINDRNFNYTFLTEDTYGIFNIDSVSRKSVETLVFEDHTFKRYSIEDEIIFTTQSEGVIIASNSPAQLERIIKKENVLKSEDLEKIFATADHKKTSVFINHTLFANAFSGFFPEASIPGIRTFSNWSGLDIDLTVNGMTFNGISIPKDENYSVLNLFKNTGVSKNEIARITPATANGFLSFTFKDFEKLQHNLNLFNKDSTQLPKDHILFLTNEVGLIYENNERIFVVKTFDSEKAKNALDSQQQIEEEFRGSPLYLFEQENEFKDILNPLLSVENIEFYCILENFLIFAETKKALKNVITNYQNNNTLEKRNYYQKSVKNLSSESSLLLVARATDFESILADNIREEFRNEMQNMNLQEYGIGAIQFVQEKSFAHIHGVFEKKIGKESTDDITEQIFSLKMDAKLATNPFLVHNHLNNQMDIAVQDEKNVLYLISNKGEVLWKKLLDSRILGEIKQVDLYKNGRLQLAFSTQNSIEVIDRNGNSVQPFPLEFNDEITQPLAIFDYDNKRNYRFLIAQNNEILMYNSKAKMVRGFNFRKGQDEILQSPKHIRIGTKDYILIPESSGKLNILNRRGNIRIRIKENIKFSGNPWFLYESQFISTSAEGNLVKIDNQGSVSTEIKNLAENHHIDATAKTLVTLSENLLNIKGKEVTLDYGLYTAPRIFYVNDKIYVAVTDTQAQRVFIFDSNADLLPNFPVYGTSQIDLNNADTDSNLEFVVQGEENEILLYKM